jgi:hypothetical protein
VDQDSTKLSDKVRLFLLSVFGAHCNPPYGRIDVYPTAYFLFRKSGRSEMKGFRGCKGCVSLDAATGYDSHDCACLPVILLLEPL